MFDLSGTYSFGNQPMATYPVVEPNIRTGEGRMKIRGANKLGDQKKKVRRKIAKKSRKMNRR